MRSLCDLAHVEANALEELACLGVGVLVGTEDVRAVAVEHLRQRRDDALAVGAGDEERRDVRGPVGHRKARGGHSTIGRPVEPLPGGWLLRFERPGTRAAFPSVRIGGPTMHNGRKHKIAISVGSVVGGLVGTAALEKAMGLSQKLPEPLQMPETHRDPGDYVVTRVEELAGSSLTPRAHARAVAAVHWLYGLAWTGALAAVARPLKMHRLVNAALAGAAMGAICWAGGYLGWLPRLGLSKPVARERPTKTAAAIVGHILYGLVAAAPICAAELAYRRRRRIFARRALFFAKAAVRGG